MKFSALSRTGFAVALSAVLASMMAPAQAETVDSIFAKVSPSVRDRMFFRLNYILANVKTSSGDAYDVTGPVVAYSDLRNLGTGGSYTYPRASAGLRRTYTTQAGVFEPSLQADVVAGCQFELAGLGAPCGVRARAQAMVGTPALSVGYYLDSDFEWMLEAYVLAAPLKVDVYGDGANHINGQNILKLKLLPPTAILGKFFGKRDDRIRPFVGLGGSYAIFFDERATDALNTYIGGSSSGDTTIKVKNVVGFGPFVGLKANFSDDWHISLNIGKLRYKTEATLTTRNTVIRDGAAVLSDYGANAQLAISGASSTLDTLNDPNGVQFNGLTNLMCDLAAAKHGSASCNQGTYVRKQSTVMDNTMFMIGVGRSF